MGVLAWIVAPAVAGPGATDERFTVILIAALTGGLIWQCVLVVVLVAREQRSLRWPVVRDALWLTPPSDSTGRRGGRSSLWAVPFVLGFAVLQLIPFGLSGPSSHDFGKFLTSAEGHDTLRGKPHSISLYHHALGSRCACGSGGHCSLAKALAQHRRASVAGNDSKSRRGRFLTKVCVVLRMVGWRTSRRSSCCRIPSGGSCTSTWLPRTTT
jgi:hypothetical protein